jgi:hypothetical protein
MTKRAIAERDEARAKLREWLKPGDTVYTILRHVSASGMSREIGVVILQPDGKGGTVDLHPNYLVGKAIGERIGKRDGVIMGGCGMDMGFQLVYMLSWALWPEGVPCAGDRCCSNDHSNHPDAERGPEIMHQDGGYALRQRWL